MDHFPGEEPQKAPEEEDEESKKNEAKIADLKKVLKVIKQKRLLLSKTDLEWIKLIM